MCAPGVTAVLARSGALAPPNGVPAALGADSPAWAEWTVSGAPVASSAKSFSRPVIAGPDETQVEESSSAMKASLNCELRKSGYSSERKRKSNDRQLAPAGTLIGIASVVTSRAVSPRPVGGVVPSSSTVGKTPAWSGWSACVASPVERTA